MILTTAETYFLRAQASVLSLSGEDAQAMYEEGLTHAMKLWGVGDGDIADFINNSSMAQLDGTQAENLEKIAVQRWLACYTDGFEGWSIVRETGYPSELAAGVTNDKLYYIGGDLGDMYPQRMRYGGDAYAKNGTNTEAAVARQGPDNQATKLWWAK